MNRSPRRMLVALLFAVASPATVFAQRTGPDLIHASIEDLMNIEVTSVSHKEQRVGDTAAAVYVITQEEIRRSGMTTVPELLDATTKGLEITARWTPARWWNLQAGYSTFHLTPHVSLESRDVAAASYDGNVPEAQWQARSTFFFARGVELSAMVFHAGELSNLHVPAYTRADGRLEVPLTRRLTLAVVGQNLFDPTHAEYAGVGAIVTPTSIPRSASVNLVWRP